MEKTGFTPGPWSVGTGSDYASRVYGSYGGSLAVVNSYTGGHGPNRDECAANARLIAASPCLYEALKDLVEDCLSLAHSRWSEFEGSDDDLVGRARAALSKVEG